MLIRSNQRNGKNPLRSLIQEDFWSGLRDLNPRSLGPKGVRTWCYMCMNYIWRCLVRKTCSPALFSPLFPRPPKAVVVKHVVVQQRSRGFAVFCRDPRERNFPQLSFIPNLILSSFFLNLVSMEITSSAVSVFGRICRIEN